MGDGINAVEEQVNIVLDMETNLFTLLIVRLNAAKVLTACFYFIIN